MPRLSIVTARSWAEATDKDQARSRAEVETRNCPGASRATLSAPRMASDWTRYIPYDSLPIVTRLGRRSNRWIGPSPRRTTARNSDAVTA